MNSLPKPSLPDELVKNILDPLLRVPDHLFADTQKDSPFATPSQSSSELLVVCKQWMRVATPLLYHVVVLRSKAQAQALELALKQNPDLGIFIRKLRLEGGFGALVQRIIATSPNITHLCLSMDIWSSDSISGLTRSLPLVNPTHVILRPGTDEKRKAIVNKCTKGLMSTLCRCVEEWKTLKTFDFLYNAWNGPSNTTNVDFGSTLALALSKSPSLTTLVVNSLLFGDYIKLIATNKNLKQIFVKSPPAGKRWDYISYWDHGYYEEPSISASFYVMLEEDEHKAIRADDRLKALVVYEGMSLGNLAAPKPTAPSNPFYEPFAGAAAEVKEKIWAKIIRFATEVDHHPEPVSYYQPHLWDKCLIKDERGNLMASNQNRLAIASVCKQFPRLTECYLYMDPELSTLDAVIQFADLMNHRPELTSHIRTLTFRRSESEDLMDDFYSCEMSDSEAELNYGDSDQALKSIISAATNLISLKQSDASYARGVRGYWLPWYILHSFSHPGEIKIRVLEGLCLSMPFSQSGFFVLGRFSRLIHLDITVEMCIHPSDEYTEIPAPDNLCLPALEKLTYAEEMGLGVRGTGKSLSSALAKFQLPAFHTLNLRSHVEKPGCIHEFLAQHGAKILDLGVNRRYDKIQFLKYCTNLRSISIRTNSPPPDVSFFKSPGKPLKTLEIIKATGPEYHTEPWQHFFDTVDLKDFPALKEFRVECCHWPTTERDLLKGKNMEWVGRSERLMEEFNVKLTNSDGKHWIPRLGTKTTRPVKKRKTTP